MLEHNANKTFSKFSKSKSSKLGEKMIYDLHQWQIKKNLILEQLKLKLYNL